MTTERRYNDPALREALRQEQAAMPHFQLADGWQDAVMKQAKSKSQRIIWTAAAAFIVLLIGVAAVLWQQEKKGRHQDTEAGLLEAGMPKEETPIVIAQAVPPQVEPASTTDALKLKRKSRPRLSRSPRQSADEIAEPSVSTSLSGNRDRMRQTMFEKMSGYSDMTDFEPEIFDEL